MKISIRALTAGILVSAFAAPVFAQSLPLPAGVPFAPTENRADFRHDARLQEYLNHHPGVRNDLERDPNLINDPQFLKKHQEFHEFLKKHPNIRNTAEDRPLYRSEPAEEKAERKAGMPEAGEPVTTGASGAAETGKETRAERRAERKAERKVGASEAAEPATAGASGATVTAKETRAERRAARRAKRAGTN